MLGISYSVDKIIMSFQGSHKEKIRITYKLEGDGFQCDALCQDGFCYQLYFRSYPDPSEYLKQVMSPLHARLMSLFDSTKDKFQVCSMDNLYNSDLFCKRSLSHEMKVMVHRVTRKGIRSVPPTVNQEEVKNRKTARNPRYHGGCCVEKK